jgi:ABC-2 type transport system permease protein
MLTSHALAPAAAQVSTTKNSGPDQAELFRRLRASLLRNSLQVALKTGRVRFFTMIGTSSLVALFVFSLSYWGFHELFSPQFQVPAKGIVISFLYDLMFFTLGTMLLFSTGIILYASLFTSPESRFLLATPARADQIFATKFQAAVAFSSWAFLILGLPILIAYGIVASVPWCYYALLLPYLLGFVTLPSAISAIICFLLVRFLPRNRKQAIIVLISLAIVLVGGWAARAALIARSTLKTGVKKDEVTGLLGQFALTQSSLMPSHWMTSGLMAAANGNLKDAVVPLGMIWSNGLVLYVLSAFAASRLYRTAFDRIAGSGQSKNIYRANLLDRVMEKLVFYLAPATRVLIVKDFRTFRRDPTQWVLLFIFGGLLLLGATNFSQFYRGNIIGMDRYVVSLINLSGTSVLICAGLSRFIYPLMSLEGRKFWILGLMPIRREQILLGKFAFAATGTLLVSLGLTLCGDLLLGIDAIGIGLHLLAVVMVAVGLSALNVGLGAYMPNFRETDPSKIVVGFGGTVNMIVGLGFLILIVATMAMPLHFAGLRATLSGGGSFYPWWAFAGVPIALLATIIAVWLPLRAGSKNLREMEF